MSRLSGRVLRRRGGRRRRGLGDWWWWERLLKRLLWWISSCFSMRRLKCKFDIFFFSFISLFSFIYLHSFKHDKYIIGLCGEWIFFFLSDLRFSIGSDYYAFGHSLRFICIFGANALLGAGVQWLRRKSGHGFYCTKEILQNGKVDVSIRHIMMLLLIVVLGIGIR